MATINKNILGNIKGSLGSVVFRERNGKLIAYTKPAKQKISRSKASVEARQKFSLAVALAKEINSNSILSAVWKKSNVNASNAYQKIIKVNSKLTEPKSLSIKNMITPKGFDLSGITAKLNNKLLEIALDKTKLTDELINANYLFCLIHLWNNNKLDFIVKLYQLELSSIDDNKQNFTIDLSSVLKKKYKDGICFITLTGVKSRGNKFFWSSTFASKFL